MVENLKFMEWTGFLLEEPLRKYYGVCEAEAGLYFPLPDEWQNLVTLQYGENESNWQVVKIDDGSVIADFMLLPTGYDQETEDNEIIVNTVTIQLKIKFDKSVSDDQRRYIIGGMMYIK